MPRHALALGTRDEVTEHGLGHVKVGNDAVFERTHGDDAARRAAEHLLGIGTNGQNTLVLLFDGDNRRLVDDNTLTSHGHERISRTKVDSHIATEIAKESVCQRHSRSLLYLAHI